MKRGAIFILIALLSVTVFAKKGTFEVLNGTFALNGTPMVVKAAELHYPRIPRPYWDHRIKMCKALGFNTICIYVFWNFHEPQEGVYDFSGQADVAHFCKLVKQNGMYLIVRPGPYVCAEWEMGGLPWWLLKKRDIRLREDDPYFLERVEKFEKELGKRISRFTIDKGGPIIMVQVENEYGSYGTNKPYVEKIRDIVRRAGFNTVPLFQCDWASNFMNNALPDLLWTMNFGTGTDISSQFDTLDSIRPDSPKMCSEYWSGWFDKWGANHETRSADEMIAGLREMLSKNISFSLYMTHGGTSFSHWAGANSPGFAPDVTSYDYDAPINEYGHTTPKFWQLRSLMQEFSEHPLPAVPRPPAELINIPEFTLSEFAPLSSGIASTVKSEETLSMEELGQGFGSVIYSTILPEMPAGSILNVDQCHDYAQVFVNGRKSGTINRMNNESQIALPQCHNGDTLTILVEAMGRINFGRAIADRKGITNGVSLSSDKEKVSLKDWTMSLIPDDYSQAVRALRSSGNSVLFPEAKSRAGYYRGFFTLNKCGDTFISTEAFGKGLVYVNGHSLGRFWSIGPQQTLYVPGCWLRKGKNEVIVLDVVGPKGKPTAFAQSAPELNKLIPEDEPAAVPSQKPILNDSDKVINAEFPGGNGWKRIELPEKAVGRFLALECISTQAGDAPAIAEMYLIDDRGERLDRESWTVSYVVSEDRENGNNTAAKIFDLQESTYWQPSPTASMPQVVVINLGSEQTVTGIEYLPRTESSAPGCIRECNIYVYSSF